MLHAYEQPATVYDDLDMLVGEAMLDVLRGNCILLDALSFRSPDITSSSAGTDTSTPNHYSPLVATEVIYRGSFQMKAGMTTLTLEGWAQKGATEDFQLFLNGAGMLTQAVPNGAAFTLTCSVAALAVDEIGIVIVQRSGVLTGPQALAAKYVIYDAYVSPAPTIALSWPGVPTFSGTYSATLFNQLGNAQRYVAARLNALPQLGYVGQYYAHGSSVTGDTYALWWGAVERANGSNILNIRILYMNFGNVAEFYRVKVGGSTVHTSATFGVGDTNDSYLSLDLSALGAGVRLEAVIETVVTTGPTAGPSGDRNSRYHLWAVRMGNSAPATATAPYDFTADESMTSANLDTRLNAMSTTMAAVKARLDANPRIFDRVPLMRHLYGRNDEQWAEFAKNNTYTQRFTRKGSRLVVRGKGVKVGWGAYSTKAGKEITTGYAVEWAHTEQLTEGDAEETKVIYLDTLEGLRRGQTYVVIGESVSYCAELLL